MKLLKKSSHLIRATLPRLSRAIFFSIRSRADAFFLLAFFGPLCSYLFTLYPTVTNEDSGELITAAYTLDLAHPPGYPLYILIGKLFTILIPFGNIAWRINVMSAVFGALTVLFLYLLFARVIKSKTIKLRSGKFLALAAALLFAFTDIFWSQSIRAEVYTLHSFLLAATLLSLFIWKTTEKIRYLYLSFILLGLGMANHHMTALAIPPVIIFVVLQKWSLLLRPLFYPKSILAFFLGLAPYLYMPIRTTYFGPYDNPAMIAHPVLDSWPEFWNFVNRKIYGGTVSGTQSLKQSIGESGIFSEKITDSVGKVLNPFWEALSGFINAITEKIRFLSEWDISRLSFVFDQFFGEYFWAPGAALFFLGLFYWLRKPRAWHVLMVLSFFFLTFVIVSFIGLFPGSNPVYPFYARPFLIPGLLVMACGIFYGLRQLWRWSEKNRIAKGVILVATIFLLAFQFATNARVNYQRDNYLIYDLVKGMLDSLPPDGVLGVAGKDSITFPVYYLRKVEGFQTEKEIEVIYAKSGTSYSLNKIGLRGKPVYSDVVFENYEKIAQVPQGMVYGFSYVRKGTELEKCREGTFFSDWSCFEIRPYKNIRDYNLRGIEKDNLDYLHQFTRGIYYVKMALNHEAEGNMDGRNLYMKKLIEETEDNVEMLGWAAKLCSSRGEDVLALRAREKIVEKWPDSVLSIQNALKAARSVGNKEAIKKYQDLLKERE